MSFAPDKDPKAGDAAACDAIELMIVPRSVDLGGFAVRRALPHAQRRMVGPFVFFDHMGPAEFTQRPRHRRAAASAYRARHRHLSVRRRDRASRQPRLAAADPAGRRQLDDRGTRHRALRAHRAGAPHGRRAAARIAVLGRAAANDEETEPGFAHVGSAELPIVTDKGRSVRVVAGSLLGARSPVPTLSDTLFYAEATLAAGATHPVRRRARRARALCGRRRDRHRRRQFSPAGCWSSVPATPSR